jgi:hypothetical protein
MTEKYYDDNTVYLEVSCNDRNFKTERNEQVLIKAGTFIEGSVLNQLHGFGIAINFAPVPSIEGLSYQEIWHNRYNQGLYNCSIQDCMRVLPYKGNMEGAGMGGLHLITSESKGKWIVEINDWYGDRNQANYVTYFGTNLELLLQGLLLKCTYDKVISEEVFLKTIRLL